MLRVVHSAVVLSVSLVAIAPSLASAQATKAGVVTTLEGNVTVTRVTLAPQPLKFKDDVFVNDKVVTGEQSIARMLLGGKAVVTVRERSALTITEVPGKATIDLEAGKIAVAVAKDKMRPGESLEIRAANAVAGVRGTVVVAEVSSASAQLGGLVGPVGIFWVLKGQIEAYLANQPGNPLLVGTLQQFRGGNVSNIVPSQMPQILQGLSTGKVTPTTDQAPENGAHAGLALAGAFTGAAAGGGVTVPRVPLNFNVPILPANHPIEPPTQTPPIPPATPPCVNPSDPLAGQHGYGGHRYGRGGAGVSTGGFSSAGFVLNTGR
jgi:FecR protein